MQLRCQTIYFHQIPDIKYFLTTEIMPSFFEYKKIITKFLKWVALLERNCRVQKCCFEDCITLKLIHSFPLSTTKCHGFGYKKRETHRHHSICGCQFGHLIPPHPPIVYGICFPWIHKDHFFGKQDSLQHNFTPAWACSDLTYIIVS